MKSPLLPTANASPHPVKMEKSAYGMSGFCSRKTTTNQKTESQTEGDHKVPTSIHSHALLLLLLLVSNGTSMAGDPSNTERNALLPALANAIRITDLETIEEILKEHSEQHHSRDENGNTPLHLAALHGYADCVRELLDQGADANATNYWHASPLLYGVVNADVVRMLLEQDANPNATSLFRMTPLLAATKRGHSYEVAKLLVEAGADVNAPLKDFFQGGPLFSAIGSGDQRTIDLLISRGAELDVQGNEISPLQRAAMCGDLKTVKRLVEAGVELDHSYEQIDSPGTALGWAMYAENHDIAAYLIDRGADLQKVSHDRPQDAVDGVGWFRTNRRPADCSQNDSPRELT